MIKQNPAASLPTGASDILLALEHLPSENTLAYALGSARYLILNRGHWELITQDQLPIVANPDVLQLGQLSRLTRDSEADTLTEAVTEAVRELLAEQDVFTAAPDNRDKRDVCVDKAHSLWYNEYIAVRRRDPCRRRAKLCPEPRTLRGGLPI